MAARYAFFKNPPREGDEDKQVLHARIVPGRVIRMDRIATEVSAFSSFSAADIKGLMQAIGDQIVSHLEDGDELDVEGIGHFSVSLRCPKITKPTQARAEDIYFKSVNFRCSKRIVDRLRYMKVEREPGTSQAPLYTEEERKKNILDFLEKEGVVMSSTCMGLNACTRYMALKDLKDLQQKGKIVKLGRRKIAVYALAAEE